MWHERQADGVLAIDAKGAEFDPSKMEAITTIPASDAYAAGTVVDVLDARGRRRAERDGLLVVAEIPGRHR